MIEGELEENWKKDPMAKQKKTERKKEVGGDCTVLHFFFELLFKYNVHITKYTNLVYSPNFLQSKSIHVSPT
jgi:hypothetical protein